MIPKEVSQAEIKQLKFLLPSSHENKKGNKRSWRVKSYGNRSPKGRISSLVPLMDEAHLSYISNFSLFLETERRKEVAVKDEVRKALGKQSH